MNIEEQKNNFLNLLRTEFKAKQARWKSQGFSAVLSSSYFAESLNNFEQMNRIKINESVLSKYDFSGSDFWEIICPSLKEDGYLEDFGDPNNISEEYFKNFSGYIELKEKMRELEDELPSSLGLAKSLGLINEGDEHRYRFYGNAREIKGIENEIKKVEKEYKQLVNMVRNSYPFFVINIKKLFQKNIKQKTIEKKDIEYLIRKNGNGDYFYKDKIISVQTSTIYFKIFDILYSNCNQDGFLSYEDIEKKLINQPVPATKNSQARNKQINNAISNENQGFFRYAKVNNKKLENKTLNGKKLIEVVRGKGLKLNNPKI